MIPTVEVRWFLPFAGVDSQVLPEAFQAVKPATRTDWYAPGDERGGVKLREGNLEIKLFLRDLGLRDFAGRRGRGRVEAWRKWVFSGDATEPVDETVLTNAAWIPVVKHRYLRIYSEGDDGAMRPVDIWPDAGCQFEWTHLVAAGAEWVTIGFEAFGPEGDLERILLQTGATVLEPIVDRLSLEPSMSYSYPHWLEKVRSAGASLG